MQYKKQDNDDTHYGMIAEEVEKICPDLVVYGEDGNPESVKYHEMPALLLAEIQKLRKEVDDLKKGKSMKKIFSFLARPFKALKNLFKKKGDKCSNASS
jgi:hypothetical protein